MFFKFQTAKIVILLILINFGTNIMNRTMKRLFLAGRVAGMYFGVEKRVSALARCMAAVAMLPLFPCAPAEARPCPDAVTPGMPFACVQDDSGVPVHDVRRPQPRSFACVQDDCGRERERFQDEVLPDGKKYLVAFWNLENYFDPFADSTRSYDEYTASGSRKWTWNKFHKKAQSLSKAVISMKDYFGVFPSIVGFSEAESDYCFEYLVEETPLAQIGYSYLHFESCDSRGIDTGLLYKESDFEPLSARAVNVSLEGKRATRDILHVRGLLGGMDTVDVFVNHWPSKYGGAEATEPGRMHAAGVLGRICDSIMSASRGGYLSGCNIIIMGDFNDSMDSAPVSFLCDGRDLCIPDVGVVSDNRDLRPVPVKSGKAGGISSKSHDFIGTNKYRARWDIIDLLIVSADMAGSGKMVSVENGTFYIFAPSFLLEDDSKYSGYKPYRTYIGPRYNSGFSDHLPVCMMLSVRQ